MPKDGQRHKSIFLGKAHKSLQMRPSLWFLGSIEVKLWNHSHGHQLIKDDSEKYQLTRETSSFPTKRLCDQMINSSVEKYTCLFLGGGGVHPSFSIRFNPNQCGLSGRSIEWGGEGDGICPKDFLTFYGPNFNPNQSKHGLK